MSKCKASWGSSLRLAPELPLTLPVALATGFPGNFKVVRLPGDWGQGGTEISWACSLPLEPEHSSRTSPHLPTHKPGPTTPVYYTHICTHLTPTITHAVTLCNTPHHQPPQLRWLMMLLASGAPREVVLASPCHSLLIPSLQRPDLTCSQAHSCSLCLFSLRRITFSPLYFECLS